MADSTADAYGLVIAQEALPYSGCDFCEFSEVYGPKEIPKPQEARGDSGYGSSLLPPAEQQKIPRNQPVFEPAMYTEEPRPLEELVPQRPYTSRSSHSFHGGSIINFTKDGAGIFLWHVLLFEEAFVPEAWLAEAAVPPGSTGQKIQIRLNWPGCKGLSESINILDHKGDPQPVSKFKLLRRVAVAIDKMMNTNTRLPGQNDGPWRIGPDGVRFYQIRLHSLRQVAKASWQPVLFWCGRPLEGVDDAPGV